MSTARRSIYLENAYLVRQALTYYDPTADAFVPWTSQPATVSITSDAAGTQVISGLSGIVMSEASAAPGTYHVTLSNSQVDNLTSYEGQMVYQQTVAGYANELRATVPLLVTLPRYA